MPALWAGMEFGSTRRGIERITADAMEGGFPPFEFKPAMITAVIVDPQTKKCGRHEHAVDNGGGGKVEHRAQQIASTAQAATKKRAGSNPGALKLTCLPRADRQHFIRCGHL